MVEDPVGVPWWGSHRVAPPWWGTPTMVGVPHHGGGPLPPIPPPLHPASPRGGWTVRSAPEKDWLSGCGAPQRCALGTGLTTFTSKGWSSWDVHGMG
eukprot:gene5483-biopygen23721